jgi:hypothetical protein
MHLNPLVCKKICRNLWARRKPRKPCPSPARQNICLGGPRRLFRMRFWPPSNCPSRHDDPTGASEVQQVFELRMREADAMAARLAAERV